ncbi:MAG: hypothetical protein N3G21_01555 [Candidatus Hydrogenedentes bacterium]|nr:hypothetical protein [Candidatus Hydrogenedentota bacterium]
MNESTPFNQNDTFELFIIFSIISFVISLPFIGGCLKPMEVTPKTLHFSEGEDLKFIEIYQKPLYDRKIAFSVKTSTPWIELTPTEGILGKDDRVKVQVYLNRNFPQIKKDEYPTYATAEIVVSSYFQNEKVIATTAPNYYTEIFEGDVDLSNKSLIFSPNKSISFYGLDVKEITEFPNEFSEEERISFTQENIYEYTLEETQTINFYDKGYKKLYISGYGWIGIGEPKKSPQPTEVLIPCGANSKVLQNTRNKNAETWDRMISYHFSTPNITAFPVDVSKGGKVYLRKQQNKIVITYLEVPTSADPQKNNSFQVEIYFMGKITLNYLTVDSSAIGIVGLSYGTGKLIVPGGFVESDLVQ